MYHEVKLRHESYGKSRFAINSDLQPPQVCGLILVIRAKILGYLACYCDDIDEKSK
jgi:hypothetical protein